MLQKAKKNKSRDAIPFDVRVQVLTEAGYRCAVPTCRGILALDLHHMVQVSDGGGDVTENLLPLCPTCHALYHRRTIKKESIYAWKSFLVSLTRAFDVATLDQLLFLNKKETKDLRISGDGILSFARLVAAGYASFKLQAQNGPLSAYSIALTPVGKQLVLAWSSGKLAEAKKILGA